MVDVNRAWDFKTACEGVKLLEAGGSQMKGRLMAR